MTGVVPFGKTNWRIEVANTHRQVVDHCWICPLCGPCARPRGAPGALVNTACKDGVLLFSEWLTAFNHRVVEVQASDVIQAMDQVLAESRGGAR